MSIKSLTEKLEADKEIKFRLYNMEYIIKYKQKKYITYPTLYERNAFSYDSLEDLVNNYKIYGDSIFALLYKIK